MVEVADLIKKQNDLAEATKAIIASLLKERHDLQGSTAKRMGEIADSLKTLGHKRSRAKATKKVANA